ncbi:MAG: hypothetical protein K9L95_06420 [Candidatus Omnitrophica bacterium]|jgi:hypothetical protein|nr:hypothetical protein [Candidatus Omnitrophota bacterium]MCF7888272.1 hypothetical protein [Candidatus Omnitrophota bacterium]
MDIQNKISEFKFLCQELINCNKNMGKAIENPSVDLEELYGRFLKKEEELGRCYQEIKKMRNK